MIDRQGGNGDDWSPDDPVPDATVRIASAGVAPTTLPSGAVLSFTYRIESLIGKGGMGEVYRARHVELDSLHAVKMILPDLAREQKIIDLFRREAENLRRVRDDAVVGYDGMFRDEAGRAYLVMEFVSGPSLSKVLKQGALPPADMRLLRDRLAAGLAAAHEKGVIHRDLSPDNIILEQGRLEKAKIIDFGIARQSDPAVETVLGSDFAGKFAYASPEQLGMCDAEVGPRSDIYSLGLVLAAAAAGAPLEMGDTHMSVIEARKAVPDLSKVPAELLGELSAMLQPNPDDRPQSMRDLVSGGGEDADPTVRPATSRPAPPAPLRRPGKRRRGRTIAIAAALVIVVVVGVAGFRLGPLLLSQVDCASPDIPPHWPFIFDRFVGSVSRTCEPSQIRDIALTLRDKRNDPQNAFELLTAAHGLGDRVSALEVGKMYDPDQPSEIPRAEGGPNRDEACRWYGLAGDDAFAGSRLAALGCLAVLTPPGTACPQPEGAVTMEYLQSVLTCSAEDIFALARLFIDERSDPDTAFALLREAADLDHAASALEIGQMYDPQFWGQVPTAFSAANPDKARQWYHRAADLGDPDAAERLRNLGQPQ